MYFYVDFVLVGTVLYADNNGIGAYVSAGAGFSSMLNACEHPSQHYVYHNQNFTAEEIASVKLAYERTFDTYTPPAYCP